MPSLSMIEAEEHASSLPGASGYGEHEAVFEARAAEQFDAQTAASVSARAWSWQPAAGSIIVRVDPSDFDEFVRALPEVLGAC